MKLFTKTSIALITLTIVLYSCKQIPPVVVNPIITISQGEGNCNLELSDNGTTKTKGNNVVTWVCGNGVSEIVSIYKKSGTNSGVNVFQVGPMKKNPSDPKSDWFGITKNPTNSIFEDYAIDWKDSGGNPCTLDPTIKVEPNDQ